MLESVWSYVGWGVYLTRPVLASISSFGGWGVSLTRHVVESVRRVRRLSIIRPVLNLSDRYLGGDFLLHAPCWNLSMSGGEPILLAPSWHLSRSSVSGESLLHAPCWNLSRP